MDNRVLAVVLDFDGVLLESTDIKTAAFRELFADYPDKLDVIIDYHTANLGISRRVKFRHIYQDILGRSLEVDVERRLADRFSQMVVAKVARCPFVPGALEFLREYSGRVPLFVASGTPEKELRELVALRELSGFFRRVHGSPATKPVILEAIAQEVGAPAQSLLFVGDGRSDYEAATEVGAGFIGRVRPGHPDPFQDLCVPTVANLFELDHYLTGHGMSCVSRLSTEGAESL